MSYKVKIISGQDPESKPESVTITVALLDAESDEVLEVQQIGLSRHQLTDGKLSDRLQRYGKRLQASFENTGNLGAEVKGTEVELE